ncbi:OB-fold domain-containing protein [Nonomuraea sp. K274]|uniref:OB-fold domain-containing protein n=1 Tax=Nonomuraea cypriaca TaxID=1187855 RepID=A0A931EUJ0_9ACTN|nr:OB-fold domain-containing protein [Nonomuraea cypriaca]MBF8184579.1 OB-fold domain-containing protein [Nonomuraea cypriaca]
MRDVPPLALRGEERLFYERLRAHDLGIQVCAGCAARFAYPRTVCPRCLGTELRLDSSSGRGSVYSFTTIHRPAAAWRADDVPYTVALVDLDEGVRVLGDLRVPEPRVGLRVELEYDDVRDDLTLLSFVAAAGQ